MWMSAVGAQAIADLEDWFERQWAASRDFKQELIDLLDASKFGSKEYTPYQVYLKALFEYFRDDLGRRGGRAGPVRRGAGRIPGRRGEEGPPILARYDGVLIGDSVGLGKTWIGKKLLEDLPTTAAEGPGGLPGVAAGDVADGNLQRPPSPPRSVARRNWAEDFDPAPYGDADVILIDESHNFRNRERKPLRGPGAPRSACNGGRGRDGERKKIILLTATPINNDLFDLYNQIFTDSHRRTGLLPRRRASATLYRYFLHARRNSSGTGTGRGALQLAGRDRGPEHATLHPQGLSQRHHQRPKGNLAGPQAADGAVQPGGHVRRHLRRDRRRHRTPALAPYSLESYKKAR